MKWQGRAGLGGAGLAMKARGPPRLGMNEMKGSGVVEGRGEEGHSVSDIPALTFSAGSKGKG